MLLAIDVGNTHTVIGLYDQDTLRQHWRLETKKERTADELGVFLLELFLNKKFLEFKTLPQKFTDFSLPLLTTAQFIFKPLVNSRGLSLNKFLIHTE